MSRQNTDPLDAATPSEVASTATEDHPGASADAGASGEASATVVPNSTPEAPAPRSRYALGSVPNMLRSLVVIGVLMALVILLVPRVNSLSGPPIDVRAKGLEVAAKTGWPIVMAKDLPKGWQATSARFVKTEGGAMTWLAGYQAPSGNYVSVEQTRDATAMWVMKEVNRSRIIGSMSIDDQTWVKYQRTSKLQNSLLRKAEQPGELTTLITGTGTFAELVEFSKHLVPITP